MVLSSTFRSASLIAALLAGGSAVAASATATPSKVDRYQAKIDFFRTMQEVTRNERRENVRKLAQERMDRRILSRAVPMPTKSDLPDFLRTDDGAPLAGLYKQSPASPVKKTKTGSAAAAAPASSPASGTMARLFPGRKLDNDDDEVQWENFGFDPSDYSIKYSGCSAIAMYSDEEAADGGDDGGDGEASVFATQKFVVFRLCPSEYCSDDSGSDGCGNNYGEYLIPLAEYMEVYGQFKQESFEAYCEYCETCMYFENYFYGHRDLADADAGDDAAQGDDAAAADAGDDAVQGDDAAAAEETHACLYYEECKDYLLTCDYGAWLEATYGDDIPDDAAEEEEVDFSDYYECAEVEYGNYQYYIGPMCDSSDQAIQFGLFSDEACTVYVGDSKDISTISGVDFTSERASLEEFSGSTCIPCRESDQPYMVVKGDANDDDDISELCENLYLGSAKCNYRLWDVEDESYTGYNQLANEDLACSFIENVISGAYDDKGYIVIDQDEFDFSQLFSAQEIAKASTGQILGAFFVVVGCAALVVWSCFLHRALQQQSKLTILPPEQEFARQESGVMVGRSMSREFPENPENDHVLT